MSFPEIIKSLAFMKQGTRVKIVICTSVRVYSAKLQVNGITYADAFNEAEPYDRLTSVFYVPQEELSPSTRLFYKAKPLLKSSFYITRNFVYGSPRFVSFEECTKRADNELQLFYEETENIAKGVDCSHRVYRDKNTDFVHAFFLKINPMYARLYVGTPDDGYESKKVRATIPEMISSAQKNGHDILCGVNADFFDILGDFHPSGLCIKNSRVIANRTSLRPFIATLTNGSHVITDLAESPHILPKIAHAAAGMQMIVKDGKLHDVAPCEPFGDNRHPRTAVGIRNDGSVILCVVDGRIPAYSNGASLTDLGKLMVSVGAERALNVDGGGSSAVYTKKGGDFILRSRPADLFKPNAMLIRKDFNSLLAEEIKISTNEVQ